MGEERTLLYFDTYGTEVLLREKHVYWRSDDLAG